MILHVFDLAGETIRQSIWFAVSTFVLSFLRYSPSVLTPAAISQQAFETPPRVDCCPSEQSAWGGTLCSLGQDRCPFALRVSATGQWKGITATILNPDGRFARGGNSFCVQFTNRAGQKLRMAKVHLDVTLRIGHVEAARAVSELIPAGVDRFCGHVILRIPGRWRLRFQYVNPAGQRGEVSALESVI